MEFIEDKNTSTKHMYRAGRMRTGEESKKY